VPETLAHRWPWRVIVLVAVAALSYLVWRGYQQPDFILDFANLRYC
jgi:cytochrome c-type biogenesis protein CcmH/NrfG